MLPNSEQYHAHMYCEGEACFVDSSSRLPWNPRRISLNTTMVRFRRSVTRACRCCDECFERHSITKSINSAADDGRRVESRASLGSVKGPDVSANFTSHPYPGRCFQSCRATLLLRCCRFRCHSRSNFLLLKVRIGSKVETASVY